MASAVYHVDHASTGYNYGVPSLEVAEGNPHTSPCRRKSKNGTSRIRVCVRKRPLSKREARRDEDVMKVEADQKQISVKEEKLAVDLRKVTLVHKFQFDDVFPEDFSNKDVYERTVKLFVPFVVRGGKATCFAFGQTGAGKTHTLLGDSNGKGLYQFAAEDLFEMLKRERTGDSLVVWISYFEIYCGQLYDLLNKRERIQALEDYKHQVCIAGVNEIPVNETHALVQYVERGHSVRSQGSSGVNPTSSRSHAVLQIQLKDVTGNKLGRLSVIDLAGSERACDRGDPDRATRLEGAEINTSLLSLKECIRAMDQEQPHTPFRQSKLTQVLRDSLLGESQTCMLASVSPSSSSLEDTLNTLRYADRVKEINKLKTNSGHTPKNFSPNTTSTPLKGQRGVQPPTMRRTSLPAQSLNQGNLTSDQKRRSSVQPSPTKSNRDPIGVRSGPMKTPKRKTINSLEKANSRKVFHQKRNEMNHGKNDSEMLPAVSFQVIDGSSLVMRDEGIHEDNSSDKQKQESKKRGEMDVEPTAVGGSGCNGSSNVKVIVTEDGSYNEVKDKKRLQHRMVENFLSNSLPIWEDEQLERKKSHQPPPNLSFAWEVDNPHYVKSQEKTIRKSREKFVEKSESFAVFDYENPRYVDRKRDSERSAYKGETGKTEVESSDYYSKPESQMSTGDAKVPVQSLIDGYEAHLTEMRDEAGSPSSVATDNTMELLAEISQSLRNSSVSPVPDLESLDRITYTEPWNREGTSGKQGEEPGQREQRSPAAAKHFSFKEVTKMESVSPRTKKRNRCQPNQIGESLENGSGGKQNRKNDVQRRSKVTMEKKAVAGNGRPHAVTNGSGFESSSSEMMDHATDRTSFTEKVAVHHENSQDRVTDRRRRNSKQPSVRTGGFRYPDDERPSLNYFSPDEAPKTEMRILTEEAARREHEDQYQGRLSNGVTRTKQSVRLVEHHESLTSFHGNRIDMTNDKTVLTNAEYHLDERKEAVKQMDDSTQRDGEFGVNWESGKKLRKQRGQHRSVRQVETPKVDQSSNHSVDEMAKSDQETLTRVTRNESVDSDSRGRRDRAQHNEERKGRLSSNSPAIEGNISNYQGTLDNDKEDTAHYEHVSVQHIGRNTNNRITKDKKESKVTHRLKSHDSLHLLDLVDRSSSGMSGGQPHRNHKSGDWCECCSVSEQKRLWSQTETSHETPNVQNNFGEEHEISNHASINQDPHRRSSIQVGHESSPTKRIARQRKSLPWLAAPTFDNDWENSIRRKAPNNLPNGATDQGSEFFVSSVTFDVGSHSVTRTLKEAKHGDEVQAFENVKSGEKVLSLDDSGRGRQCDTSKDQIVTSAAGDRESNRKECNRQNKREVKKPDARSSPTPRKDVGKSTGSSTTSPSSKPRSPDISIYSMGGYVPTVFSLSQIPPQSAGTDAARKSSSQELKKETKKKSLKDKMSQKGIESLPSPKRFPQRSGTSQRRKGDGEETEGHREEMTTWLETAKSKNVEEGDNFRHVGRNVPDGVTEGEECTPKRAAFFRETLQPVSNQWQYVTIDGRSPVSKVKVTSPTESKPSKQLTSSIDIHESQTGNQHYNNIEYSSHATDHICSKPQHSSNELKVWEEQRECTEGKTSQRDQEINREDGERDEGHRREEAVIIIQEERGRGASLLADTKKELITGEKKQILQLPDLERMSKEVHGNEGTIEGNVEAVSMRAEDGQYELSNDHHQFHLEQQSDSNDGLLDEDWSEERRLLSPIPEGKTEEETDGERGGDPVEENRPNSASEKAIVSTEGSSSSNPCSTSHLLVRAHQEQLEELQQLCDSGWSLISRLQLGEGDVYEYLTDSNVLMERQQRCIKTFKDQLNIYAHCSTADRVMTIEEPGIG